MSWNPRIPPLRSEVQPAQSQNGLADSAEQFRWSRSRLHFAYAPNEGILQLDEARANRINLRTAQVAVPLLPHALHMDKQTFASAILSVLWKPSLLLSPLTTRVNISLPCQPPVGLIQRGPWTARVDVAALDEGPLAHLSGPPGVRTMSWNSTFEPEQGCLPVTATCSMGTPLSALLLDLLGGHDTVALVAVTHAVSLATPGGDGPALPPPRSQVTCGRGRVCARTSCHMPPKSRRSPFRGTGSLCSSWELSSVPCSS